MIKVKQDQSGSNSEKLISEIIKMIYACSCEEDKYDNISFKLLEQLISENKDLNICEETTSHVKLDETLVQIKHRTETKIKVKQKASLKKIISNKCKKLMDYLFGKIIKVLIDAILDKYLEKQNCFSFY